MQLDKTIYSPLYEVAQGGVGAFLLEMGTFTPFAVVMCQSKEVRIVETSGEFENNELAIDGIEEYLKQMAMSGEIIGVLICAPVITEYLPYPVAVLFQFEAPFKEPVTIAQKIEVVESRLLLSEKQDFLPGVESIF